LENPERIVSREQLRIHIWGTNTFVDFDQTGSLDSSKTEANDVAS
jgi:DNA-binding response OmpR family regulator